MNALRDFFSAEAGQRRRAWLNQQGDRAVNALRYYAGPAAGQIESAAQIGAILNPVVGVEEAMQGGRQAYEGEGWDRVQGVGRALSGTAATVAPLAIAGTGAADDAARAVSEALLGWSPARQGAAGEVMRFARSEAGQFPAGGGDDVAQRGQEILDMLAAGRGSEVTDDMLDLGDPVLNTRLNQYLFANYDLPMDEASRMARAGEMGFDTGTPLYHGTGADFTAVDPFRSRGMDGGEGFFTAEDPYTAGSYADLASDYGRPQIQPLIGMEGRRASHVYADFEGAPWNTFGPETDPSRWGSTRYSGEYDPFGWQDLDMDDWAGEYVTTDDIARVAREDGFSGARFYDVEDHVSGDDLGATNVRVDFDPTNIRSRFARFDPRLAHLRNLSAGLGGAASLLGMSAADVEAAVGQQNNALRSGGGW